VGGTIEELEMLPGEFVGLNGGRVEAAI